MGKNNIVKLVIKFIDSKNFRTYNNYNQKNVKIKYIS